MKTTIMGNDRDDAQPASVSVKVPHKAHPNATAQVYKFATNTRCSPSSRSAALGILRKSESKHCWKTTAEYMHIIAQEIANSSPMDVESSPSVLVVIGDMSEVHRQGSVLRKNFSNSSYVIYPYDIKRERGQKRSLEMYVLSKIGVDLTTGIHYIESG